MIDKERFIAIVLTLIVILLTIICIYSNFLSFGTYKITLQGVINNVGYEDVRGDVYTSFSTFETFACRKSRNDGILTVCGNILNFETSGMVMELGSILAIILNFFLICSYLFQSLQRSHFK